MVALTSVFFMIHGIGLSETQNRNLLDDYNVVWNSQSKNSSESMPCGGGDIGMNVWVEGGDILFYIQRSGSLAEQNEYLKLGRVRLQLDPNPFAAAKSSKFRQELKLRQGYVEITGSSIGKDGISIAATVKVWVEVKRAVIHVEVDSDKPIQATASYENWRIADEMIPHNNRRRSFFSLAKYPGEVKLNRDHVAHTPDGVLFYHRNPGVDTLVEMLIKQQGLEEFGDKIVNDLRNRTFGGIMTGRGFRAVGESEGKYQTAAYKSWNLRSEKPANHHHLRVITHIAQSETIEKWRQGLQAAVDASADDLDAARKQTRLWWNSFWERSWIVINSAKSDPADKAWRAARNYNLFRYQLGCNVSGEYPSKFNGGNFTYDANLVGGQGRSFGPDWRNWGGGVFTAQNQRLLHWPMLKAGDYDAILPQFELYRKALPGAQARVRVNFDHDGAVFSEYLGAPGVALGAGYGWKSGGRGRGEEIPFGDPRADATRQYNDLVEKGVMANGAIAYHWESQLENAYMILEYHRFSGNDITKYIPFIENAVVFFDQHYRKREKMRSGRELSSDGHLVIYPAKACETFRGATNPTDLIAGLQACIDEILKFDGADLKLRDKAYYRTLLTTIPPFTYAESNGDRVMQPAASWKVYRNAEIPQLYPLFPFNRFALGRDDMKVFQDTYRHGKFRKGNVVSWHQDGIFFARMGMTAEAADFNLRKLDDSQRRFPTFWGPGHDWVPDHNWGGSGMLGLQEMLMQTIGDKILLLPAWPVEWDVDFKLHAPHSTTVQGRVRHGKIIDLTVLPKSREKDVVVHGGDSI